MVYTGDLKSPACNGRAGSSPASGTRILDIDGPIAQLVRAEDS